MLTCRSQRFLVAQCCFGEMIVEIVNEIVDDIVDKSFDMSPLSPVVQ
jgi:hypothetical protein